jgi:DNA-binding CsgD family transcriptional regulator
LIIRFHGHVLMLIVGMSASTPRRSSAAGQSRRGDQHYWIMAELLPINDRPVAREVVAAYTSVAARALHRDMNACFADELRRLLPVDRLYAFEQKASDAAPVLYAAPFSERGQQEAVVAHGERHFRTDPVNCALTQVAGGCQRVLVRAVPSDIVDAAYRDAWFERPRILQRLSVVKPFGGKWLIMNVARRRRSGPFSDREIDLVVAMADLILPFLATVHEAARRSLSLDARPGVADIETRFHEFEPSMTSRERQVCARICLGMTSEGIALSLGIAESTVVTYRRRAYARLGISAMAELAQLVLR